LHEIKFIFQACSKFNRCLDEKMKVKLSRCNLVNFTHGLALSQ